jgi:hypothetical protein
MKVNMKEKKEEEEEEEVLMPRLVTTDNVDFVSLQRMGSTQLNFLPCTCQLLFRIENEVLPLKCRASKSIPFSRS